MTEIWKEIPDCPGYEVSDLGRVRFTKMQKFTVAEKGYMIVSVKGVLKRVHRLVLLAFIGPCPEGMEVCHNDGNPGNNKLDNLRYGTHQENMKDRLLHNTSGNITAEQAREIREAAAAGISGRALMKEYKTGGLSMPRLLRGHIYADAGGPIKGKDYTPKNKQVEKAKRNKERRREKNEKIKRIRMEYKETDITLAKLGEKNNLTEDAVSKIVRGLRGKYSGGPIKGVDY